MPKLPPRWQDHDHGPNALAGGDDCGPYAAWAIADQLGFSTVGVTIERIPPGSRSSLRHWHARHEEVAYVLAGEIVLIEDTETLLRAGDAAGWPAGQDVAHCLENRGEADAVILVAGTRGGDDVVTYPDHDLVQHRDGDARRFTRLDGTPIPEDDA